MLARTRPRIFCTDPCSSREESPSAPRRRAMLAPCAFCPALEFLQILCATPLTLRQEPRALEASCCSGNAELPWTFRQCARAFPRPWNQPFDAIEYAVKLPVPDLLSIQPTPPSIPWLRKQLDLRVRSIWNVDFVSSKTVAVGSTSSRPGFSIVQARGAARVLWRVLGAEAIGHEIDLGIGRGGLHGETGVDRDDLHGRHVGVFVGIVLHGQGGWRERTRVRSVARGRRGQRGRYGGRRGRRGGVRSGRRPIRSRSRSIVARGGGRVGRRIWRRRGGRIIWIRSLRRSVRRRNGERSCARRRRVS